MPSTTGTEVPSADDEIEILEVVGVNETEDRPAIVLDPDPPPATRPSPDTAALERELEEALREKDRCHDQWLRASAELENVRRRSEREAEQRRIAEAADLVRRLLPVLDNLERALVSAVNRDDPFVGGIALVRQQLLDILRREGLEPIEAIGVRFDPERHEAVEMVPGGGREEGTVLEEMQRGYTFRNRLVRPALVRVAGAPAAGGESSGAATG